MSEPPPALQPPSDERICRAAEQAHAEIARFYEHAIAALGQWQADTATGRHAQKARDD